MTGWAVNLKDRIAHPHLGEALTEMRKNEALSRSEFEAVQAELLRRTLRTAGEIPYYKKIFQERGVTPGGPEVLRALPILSKREVRGHRSQMLHPGIPLRSLTLAETSGSTGVPGEFYRMRYALDWGYGSGQRCKEWWGIEPKDRVLRIWGRSARFNPRLRARVRSQFSAWKDRMVGVMNLSAYNLSRAVVEERWPSIVAWGPSVIHGYASGVYLMAKYALEAGLDGRAIGLRFAITEAEKLFGFQREVIENAFGCRVLEWYGCTEVGVIATPCREGNLHIREDMVYLEIEDGSVLMTTLRERAMPLIRYEVGDQAELDMEPCPCGLPMRVLKEIHGRTHDLIHRMDGGIVHGQFFSHVFMHQPGVRKFRVVQKALDLLRVSVECESPETSLDERGIVNKIREEMGQGVEVQIQRMEAIPTDPSGKFRWVVSELEGRGSRGKEREAVDNESASGRNDKPVTNQDHDLHTKSVSG